jgi:hypothetical protein
MTSAVDEIGYVDLYTRWERGNWQAMDLDFSVDREHWRERLTETQRRAALWNYALFLHGEHAVASTLAPYVDAAPRPEQKYFLTTQQVDESRHAVFFARFMNEVVGAGDDVDSAMEATRGELTWGFRKLFARLDRMAEELRRDPSRERLAAGLLLYHVVIEGAIAQSGQHFIEEYLEREDILPGFRAGIRNVSVDEQRHIAFGVKLLAELCADDERCREAAKRMMREIVPWSLALFVPPGFDRSYTECFGFSIEDIYEAGSNSLLARLRAAGLPLEELDGALPLRLDESPRLRAERAVAMLEAGVLGEKTRPPSRDPEIAQLVFDSMGLSVDPRQVPRGGMTIQWEFDDYDPWHLVVDNGSTGAARGRAARPDVVFRCSYEDWIDVAARRADPRTMMLRRRLRPRGNPLALVRVGRLFGG